MIYVVLPALNEEISLERLIPDLAAELDRIEEAYRIVVVDDGSSDHTPDILKKLQSQHPLDVLRHAQNLGYGASIRAGLQHVLAGARPEDILVTMDSDHSHPPSYIAEMRDRLQRGSDVVTASYQPPGRAVGVPVHRRIMSQVANALFRLRCGIKGVSTYTNGFRAYRIAALQQAQKIYGEHLAGEPGFCGGTQLFLQTCRAGAKATEIPFILRYDRRGKLSKIRIWPTIRGYLRVLCRASRP